jgi:hypothetical protein
MENDSISNRVRQADFRAPLEQERCELLSGVLRPGNIVVAQDHASKTQIGTCL